MSDQPMYTESAILPCMVLQRLRLSQDLRWRQCADAKNAYPVGQMMWVVADEDIGRKGGLPLILYESAMVCMSAASADWNCSYAAYQN